nr:hypothetical protein [Tanacetum cinerariifolium]
MTPARRLDRRVLRHALDAIIDEGAHLGGHFALRLIADVYRQGRLFKLFEHQLKRTAGHLIGDLIGQNAGDAPAHGYRRDRRLVRRHGQTRLEIDVHWLACFHELPASEQDAGVGHHQPMLFQVFGMLRTPVGVKQGADAFLQRCDRSGHAGRRHIQSPRGRGKAALLAHGNEDLHFLKSVHGWARLYDVL